ncbi:hypothetical protein DLM_0403 [Aquitalea magnusonii]|uniref:Uncharacterized protein n=1 Tax=Aquitalea magnusonii TaxID=332411 RepID=A0A3G9G950_9NEIS|nr:hypothetical protein DLM_0403 [Aquitalea magnusonii]
MPNSGQWHDVHCRIGSSEMTAAIKRWIKRVHCRIGSSEIVDAKFLHDFAVHCRIGSSESARS